MKSHNELAVSPVVGVMLMLVVVIIIAAVVSGFAGGLVGGNNQKVPQLAMDVKIVNSGVWSTSYLRGEVSGVDAPISTKNLKIVTSWTKDYHNGTVLRGGATTTPGVVNFNAIYSTHGSFAYDLWRYTAPQGYGTGVGQNSSQYGNIFWIVWPHGTMYNLVFKGDATNETWWGNFNLQAGTEILCRPFGGSNSGQASGGQGYWVGYTGSGPSGKYYYNYSDVPYSPRGGCPLSIEGGLGYPAVSCSGGYFYPYPTQADPMPNTLVPLVTSLPTGWDPRTYSIDQMQGVLGNNWNELRPGDIVHMKIIHIPTGKIVWEKDIPVEGSII